MVQRRGPRPPRLEVGSIVTGTIVGATKRGVVVDLGASEVVLPRSRYGVAGDRLVHVQGPRGVLTGRTRYGLLTIPASTGQDGPLVDGHPWDSWEAHALVLPHGGRLTRYTGPERFDVLNVLVATDDQVAAAGVDVRRLRPNILIGGVAPGEEAGWPGHALVIGDVVIGMFLQRSRCVVTTIDPDTGA